MTTLNPLPYYSIYSQFFYKYFSYIHICYFLLWPTEFNQCLPLSLELSVIACCTQWVHSWTMIATSQDPIAERSAENTPGPSMTDCSWVPVQLWVPDCSGCVGPTGCYSTSLRLIFWIIHTYCLFLTVFPEAPPQGEGGTLDCHVVSAFWDICKLHVDTVCTVCSIQTGRPHGLSVEFLLQWKKATNGRSGCEQVLDVWSDSLLSTMTSHSSGRSCECCTLCPHLDGHIILRKPTLTWPFLLFSLFFNNVFLLHLVPDSAEYLEECLPLGKRKYLVLVFPLWFMSQADESIQVLLL